MGYGGYFPYPRRFGGGKPALKVMHESLNAQRGSTFDPQPGTNVWLENMAFARAIVFDGWGTNERLGNQWHPERTSDMLPRWERIFGILPPVLTGLSERRAELKLRWQRFGVVANHAKMQHELSARLGDFFVSIEYLDVSIAVVHSPAAGYPWGTQIDGVPWYSSSALILVLLQKPAGASEEEFYAQAAKVHGILDPLAPAWTRFTWYRRPVSTPIAVAGGPSQAGFYLDDEHNLDNNVFDAPDAAPTIVSIVPNNGPDTGGGAAVTITGTNLFHLRALNFGASNQIPRVTSRTATTIVLDSPIFVGGGLVGVTVQTWSGTVTKPNAYTFT